MRAVAARHRTDSRRRRAGRVDAARSRHGRHGCRHHRRVGDLHDFRRGLSLLLGKSLTGPTPRDVLEVPIFYTICLLSSSLTIHLAGKRLERDERERVPRAVAAHDRAWRPVHVSARRRNGTG